LSPSIPNGRNFYLLYNLIVRGSGAMRTRDCLDRTPFCVFLPESDYGTLFGCWVWKSNGGPLKNREVAFSLNVCIFGSTEIDRLRRMPIIYRVPRCK